MRGEGPVQPRQDASYTLVSGCLLASSHALLGFHLVSVNITKLDNDPYSEVDPPYAYRYTLALTACRTLRSEHPALRLSDITPHACVHRVSVLLARSCPVLMHC